MELAFETIFDTETTNSDDTFNINGFCDSNACDCHASCQSGCDGSGDGCDAWEMV